jgi:hypothetical protein
MKREEVLAILDELIDVPVIECAEDQEFVDGAKRARDFIASALDDAERYRWLRARLWKSDVAEMAFDYPTGIVFGPGSVDRAIDTARAAAAGGEGVL